MSCIKRLLWWVRGVTGPQDYRALCRRCRRTGQAHLTGDTRCLRFKP